MGRHKNEAANAFIKSNWERGDEEAALEFSRLFYPIKVDAYRKRRVRLGAAKESGRRAGTPDSYKRKRRTKKQMERDREKQVALKGRENRINKGRA